MNTKRTKRIRTFLFLLPLLVVTGSFLLASPAQQADTLPGAIGDTELWRLVSTLSEADGPYQYENFISNEASIQNVIPLLKEITKPGGVYIGVAPEQNFTYISALQPKIAFIVDIRRQNMVELFLYKALFELSPTRADFVGNLFSLKRPTGLDEKTSAAAMFAAYAKAEKNRPNTQAVREVFAKHQFGLSPDDLTKIDYIYQVFAAGGPSMTYAFASASNPGGVPVTYAEMMTATAASDKRNWSYLGSEEAYQYVRELDRKNLIIPLVGDFAGSKTLRGISEYLKSHNARVSTFYVSNVEGYLRDQKLKDFHANVATLPVDASSMFIRWVPAPSLGNISWFTSSMGNVVTTLAPIADLADLFKAGNSPNSYAETLRATGTPESVVRSIQDPSSRKVAGKVIGTSGLKPNETISVELVQDPRGSGVIFHTDVGADGVFEFRNVQPRAYQAIVLKSCKGCGYFTSLAAPVTVVVGDQDVRGLQLNAAPAR